MKKTLAISLVLVLIISSSILSFASDSNSVNSLKIDSNNTLNLNESDLVYLPKQIQSALSNNDNLELISFRSNKYDIQKTKDGNIEKTLIETKLIDSDESLLKYIDEIKTDKSEVITQRLSTPTEDQEITIGIAAYSFSHPSHSTAYTIQGFWEWDESALGAYSSRYDIIGLTFFGQTEGYDYNCQSNNIHTSGSVNYDLLDSNDNGAAYTQEDLNVLTEGAMWAKVISDKSNSLEEFEAKFMYEYFSGDSSPSYIDIVVEYILGAFSVPSPLNNHERFEVLDEYEYGNN